MVIVLNYEIENKNVKRVKNEKPTIYIIVLYINLLSIKEYNTF